MKILQLCSAREIGGGEKHLADLANALVNRGHEVFAALSPASPVRGELSSLSPQNILELPMRNALSLRSAIRLSRYVRDQRIELVHGHMARDYPLAALARGRSGAQLVLTRHVLFPLNRIHRLTLRRTARVIAVSEAVANSLRMQAIFDPDKITLIHNGIDLARFAKSREATINRDQNRKLRIGMIGHLAPIKGQEDFIRAAAIVCTEREDVEFIIAGEDKSRTGENRSYLEKLIRDLQLERQVRLLGWVDDVAALLSTFDLFVSPSHSEPFGLSIVEAMAAGVPVIATMSEGAREIIDADQTGCLVSIGDVEAMTKAIAELLADETQRKRLARNAQIVARERFSLEQMVDRVEELYREVIALAQ